MKKILKNILFIMIVLFSCNQIVYASEVYYTNNNGINMTEEEFLQLQKFYSLYDISNLTEEQFDYEMTYLFYKVDSNNIFVREDIYYGSEGEIEEVNHTLVSEQEYNSENSYIATPFALGGKYCDSSSSTYSYCWDTQYKQLQISVNYTDVENHFMRVNLINIWKSVPSNKTFDVLGIMWPAGTFEPGNIQGYQNYKDSNGSGSVSYSYPGTNTVYKTTGSYHGIAIAQNIVNSVTSDLVNRIILDGTATNYGLQLFGSYQHATISSTLTDAHDFTFSRSGLGGVFSFGQYSKPKFDAMGGVNTNVVYSYGGA